MKKGTNMKKTLYLFTLIMFASLFLTSCKKAPETVSDSVLQITEDKYLDKWGFNDCISVEKEVEHHPDKENHLDTVNINYRFIYPYGYVKTEVSGISYQYDRASDLWKNISEGQKSDFEVVWDVSSFKGTYSGSLQYPNSQYPIYYDITINDIDPENLIVDLSGNYTYKAVHDYLFGPDEYYDVELPVESMCAMEVLYADSIQGVTMDSMWDGNLVTDEDRSLLHFRPVYGEVFGSRVNYEFSCWISLKRGIGFNLNPDKTPKSEDFLSR